MKCSNPPPLSEDDFLAVLDETAGDDVRSHLATCDDCRRRLAEVAQFDRSLQFALKRVDCPTAFTLGDYALGLLAPEATRQLATHLTSCPRCRAEMVGIAQVAHGPLTLVADPDPIAGNYGRAVELATPQVALRGATHPTTTVATSGDITLMLNITPESAGLVQITGQLAAEDQDRWNSALVVVWQSEVERAVSLLDAMGGFTCQVPAGRADFAITRDDGFTLRLPGISLAAATDE